MEALSDCWKTQVLSERAHAQCSSDVAACDVDAAGPASHVRPRSSAIPVQSFTPFSHVVLERRGPSGEELGVLVVQGTFRLRTGEPLELADEQRTVQLTDAHHGDARAASLRMPSAMATYRPRTDVTVDAVAHAPEGRPRAEWPVSIRVGPVAKQLLVRGPSEWVHGPIFGWRKRASEPTTRVPITYERAFGGSFEIDGKRVEEVRNPHGTGYLPRGMRVDGPVAAPQIVHVGEPDHHPGHLYVPAGLGATRSFDPTSCQAAHPDLTAPGHLRGDEPIVLVNLRSDGQTFRSQLPGVAVWGRFDLARRSLEVQAVLDGVHLDIADDDPENHVAVLTYRLVFPLAIEAKRLVIGTRCIEGQRSHDQAPILSPRGTLRLRPSAALD